MNVLSIGNSFSQDSQRYLHAIAAAAGVELHTFNLMTGGCTLSQHYRNMLSELPAYTLEMNGVSTGFPMSLKAALLNREWDVITIQQASYLSTKYETYQPYLSKLADYIRLCVPHAKLLIHQTWAYQQGSERLQEKMGYADQMDMFHDLKRAYAKAAEAIKPDGVIPSGTLFQYLLSSGAETVHRDTFHASYGLGRYALGLLWYKVLTGNPVVDNTFADFDEPVPAEEIALAKRVVDEVYRKY